MSEKIKEITLWVGAVVGSLALLWTAVIVLFGVTPLVFTTGSMSPEIKAGDLAFARTIDASEIKKGDVVSVIGESKVRITHRVVKVENHESGAVLTLKGDANPTSDKEAYNVTSVERVTTVVPKGGYIVNAVSSQTAVFIGGMFVMVLVFFGFSNVEDNRPSKRTKRNEKDSEKGQDSSESRKGFSKKAMFSTLSVVMIAGAFGLTLNTAPQGTLAAYTDSGTMNTGSLGSASAPPAPASITCENSPLLALNPGAIFTWPAIPDQNGHKVHIYFQVYTDAALTNQLTNGEAQWVPASPYLLAPGTTGWNRVRLPFNTTGDAWVRVRGVYLDSVGNPTWVSSDQRVYRIRRATNISVRTSCEALVQ